MSALTIQRKSTTCGERLEVTGELTYGNLWPLRRELLRPAAAAYLTVDLRGVSFLDNDGVALLIHAQRLLRGEGLTLTLLTAGGSQPDRLLRLRRLDTVIPLLTLSAGDPENIHSTLEWDCGRRDVEASRDRDAPGERPPMNAALNAAMNADTLTLAVGARETPEGAVLALAGDVDLHTLPVLEAALAGAVRDALAARAGARLTLDLCAVVYMDSGGLAALVRARKSLAAAAGMLHLRVAPDSQPDRVLRLSRLDALMPLTYAPAGCPPPADRPAGWG